MTILPMARQVRRYSVSKKVPQMFCSMFFFLNSSDDAIQFADRYWHMLRKIRNQCNLLQASWAKLEKSRSKARIPKKLEGLLQESLKKKVPGRIPQGDSEGNSLKTYEESLKELQQTLHKELLKKKRPWRSSWNRFLQDFQEKFKKGSWWNSRKGS